MAAQMIVTGDTDFDLAVAVRRVIADGEITPFRRALSDAITSYAVELFEVIEDGSE